MLISWAFSDHNENRGGVHPADGGSKPWTIASSSG
jgi:hypothetical protein